MNTCIICSREFVYLRSKGHTRAKCNSCQSNLRRRGLKKKCLDFLGGKCIICSYDKCEQALEFHHKEPSEKDFHISGAHCRSWESIKIELEKCIILCANCHRETHNKIFTV